MSLPLQFKEYVREKSFGIKDLSLIKNRFFRMSDFLPIDKYVRNGGQLRMKLTVMVERRQLFSNQGDFKVDTKLEWFDPKIKRWRSRNMYVPSTDGSFFWEMCPDLRMFRYLMMNEDGFREVGFILGDNNYFTSGLKGRQFANELFRDLDYIGGKL